MRRNKIRRVAAGFKKLEEVIVSEGGITVFCSSDGSSVACRAMADAALGDRTPSIARIQLTATKPSRGKLCFCFRSWSKWGIICILERSVHIGSFQKASPSACAKILDVEKAATRTSLFFDVAVSGFVFIGGYSCLLL